MRNRLITPFKEILDALLKTPFRPDSFIMNGQEIPYMQLKIPVEIRDLFGWLAAQTLYPKVYWENSKDSAIAGIGEALSCHHIPIFNHGKGPRFYGGNDFAKRIHSNWRHFPSSIYFLPLAYIEKNTKGTFLTINRVQTEITLPLEEEVPLNLTPLSYNRFDSPSFSEWQREVTEILKRIAEGDFQKIVLARCSRFEYAAEISPYAILKNLYGDYRFAFQFSREQTFIGTSPETLYRRDGLSIESTAIAGTRKRGKTEKEDKALASELKAHPKEQHEFEVVEKTIKKTLAPFCSVLEVVDQKVLKTPFTQHLYHLFRGTLYPGFGDQEIIQALHPTPAVGGAPRSVALEEIIRREKFDRGWYAAPVGWVEGQRSHHLVGIRSALVEENSLSLFAGTGLVAGSIPLYEWEELEHKISQFTGLL